jgi:hypothetical protein
MALGEPRGSRDKAWGSGSRMINSSPKGGQEL